MSATITVEERHAGIGYLIRSGHGNAGAYATGGVPLTPSPFELGVVDHLWVGNSGAYRFETIKTDTQHWLLKAYTDDVVTGISAEVADTTDISAIDFRWEARGAY